MNGPVLKTGGRKSRGFESHPLRQVSRTSAAAPDDGSELVTILRAADEALYRAKLAGRNRVVTRDTRPEAIHLVADAPPKRASRPRRAASA